MATLTANSDQTKVSGGDYTFKVTGALDIQIQIEDEAFSTIESGSYSVASDGVMTLPECTVKIINMGANSLILANVRY